MTRPALPIHDMSDRHVGLTKAVAASYTEAARVSLSRHHQPPRPVTIDDDGRSLDAEAMWEPPDDRTVGAWANQTDTTEAGAYAVVLAAAELARGILAVRRAETGTGADYYVGPPGSGLEDLEDCLRLEVSGTDSPDDRELIRRLSTKIGQARNGHSSLPAIAGVVGFPNCRILLKSVA